MSENIFQGSSATFGRRMSTKGNPPNPPELLGEDFEAHYTWRMNWIAVVILVSAYTGANDLLNPASDGFTNIPLTSFDPALMWLGTILMGVIGFTWLLMGLVKGRALAIDHNGVSGFSLFGTKKIRWDDIDRLQLKNDVTYGMQLIIHAKRNSPSGSIWLNCIPVYLKSVNRSQDEIVKAIRYYRPELTV